MAKKIKHVFGNRLRLQIRMTYHEVAVNSGNVNEFNVSLYPLEVSVRFSKGYGSYNYDVPATYMGDVVTMEDNGTIPVGTWAISVVGVAMGIPFRYKRDVFLEVVDATEDGGDYANDEVDVLAYYPIVNGRSSAVVITENSVMLQIGGRIGTDEDGDDENTLNAEYGDGSITETDDEIIINI